MMGIRLDAGWNRAQSGQGKRAAWALMAGCLTLTSIGCQGRRQPVEPVAIQNRELGPMTIAVAPAINQSGSLDFDPARFADRMVSELSRVDGVRVIPVSRVLAALTAQGAQEVESPQHALELAQILRADALLVFSVLDYDPYDPPLIGITCQLYGARPGSRHGRWDPITLSRQPGLEETGPREVPGLLAQTQRVFDASHDATAQDIRRFARVRGWKNSPYGWRLYVVSQQHFIEYCCFATLERLFDSSGAAIDEGSVRNVRHDARR